MEQRHRDSKSLSSAASQEVRPVAWVAPLQSIKVFSIAEFTQYEGNPGSDGTPTAHS